jgi:50S ribosomal protein L16 3-hydroxylase
MDITQSLPLLGGLTPAQFMKRHWHKKPLLVRQAIPGFTPLLDRKALFGLAAREEVESRLVAREGRQWRMARGPFAPRALPPLQQARWTLLVQGVDLHEERAQALLRQFAFIPAARLDDLMVSFATEGGGVGPHFDSYDVFLLQAQGRRRWRYGRQSDLSLQPNVPLKILKRFAPEHDAVLEPGDLLYLPPGYAHDGVAVGGDCQTYSIGFRSPARAELARELLQRVAEQAEDLPDALYADPSQPATAQAGAIPGAMQAFGRQAVAALLKDAGALERALGEYLTEPKANVWFEGQAAPRRLQAVVLDGRTRMLHDAGHVYVNGESWRAGGEDAALMRRLADHRRLERADVQAASAAARALLRSWCEAGWARSEGS